MKTGSKILIGFLAAALTYTSLMLFAGRGYSGYRGFHTYGDERYMHCQRFNRENAEKPASIKSTEGVTTNEKQTE